MADSQRRQRSRQFLGLSPEQTPNQAPGTASWAHDRSYPPPDHYERNSLVSDHFSVTPELTTTYTVYDKYATHHAQRARWCGSDGIAKRVKAQVEPLYRRHGVIRCHHHELYICGSERQAALKTRDRMMVLVIELKPYQLHRWYDMHQAALNLLHQFHLDGETGVCVRYYRISNEMPRTHIRLSRNSEFLIDGQRQQMELARPTSISDYGYALLPTQDLAPHEVTRRRAARLDISVHPYQEDQASGDLGDDGGSSQNWSTTAQPNSDSTASVEINEDQPHRYPRQWDGYFPSSYLSGRNWSRSGMPLSPPFQDTQRLQPLQSPLESSLSAPEFGEWFPAEESVDPCADLRAQYPEFQILADPSEPQPRPRRPPARIVHMPGLNTR